MTTVPITVVIPVGPHPSNIRWLRECLESLNNQTRFPAEVLIIDDGANIEGLNNVRIWKAPWRLGVSHAFNFGVALASNDLVIMLGSDDWLYGSALETAYNTYSVYNDPLGYYAYMVRYADGREQDVPCNAAMVHKHLWRHTGGFPVEAAIGACDTWLISLLLLGDGKWGNLYHIGTEPLYHYRNHAETDTAQRGEMYGVMIAARDVWLRRKMETLR